MSMPAQPWALWGLRAGQDPQFGKYLGLHHAGPLVSDVLQCSSYVYLLHP